MPTTKSITPAKARRLLKERGHSLRTAAPHLGVEFTHLHRVLNGTRTSKRLLNKVAELPARNGGSK